MSDERLERLRSIAATIEWRKDASVRLLDLKAALDTIDALVAAAEKALYEMCNTVAPRDSFTDAVDAMDAALALARKGVHEAHDHDYL